MIDNEEFIAKIIANPDDDTPRLIYAEWLDGCRDEKCDARAEFIRVQVELASIPEPEIKTPGSFLPINDEEYTWANCRGGCEWDPIKRSGHICRFHSLRRREKDLLPKQLSLSFPKKLRRLVSGNRYQFNRGFVETITATWDDWLVNGNQIRSVAPLRKVRLGTRPPYFRMWAMALKQRHTFKQRRTFQPGVGGDEWCKILEAEWLGVSFNFLDSDNIQNPHAEILGNLIQMGAYVDEDQVRSALGIQPAQDD